MFAIAYIHAMQSISSTDLRKNLSKTLDEVERNREPVIVTRAGAAPSVILPLSEYNRLGLAENFMLREDVDRKIAEGLESARSGLAVSEGKVMAWIKSWGGDDELPPPEPDTADSL